MVSCLQHLHQCRQLLANAGVAIGSSQAAATAAAAAAIRSPLIAPAALAAATGDPPLSPHATAAIIAICIALVLFAGVMAGLTLGLLSLDR